MFRTRIHLTKPTDCQAAGADVGGVRKPMEILEHETDDETISLSSKGSSAANMSKSSKSSKSSTSSESSKKKKTKKSKSRDKGTKEKKSSERRMKQRKHKVETQSELKKISFKAADAFKTNTRKLQTLVALKQKFGLDSDELVEREKKSDLQYKRRSMDLEKAFMEMPEYQDIVYDWDMPLCHDPHLALCQVTSIMGYDESMTGSCFYNGSDFNKLRLEKFIDDHPDEYEWVAVDEEECDRDEIIEEEIVYEYYEEEVIEEVPMEPLWTRRSSLRSLMQKSKYSTLTTI
ncbi:MAG: hypothetical protein SGBAC_005111 [Bacillariaceae sp.]